MAGAEAGAFQPPRLPSSRAQDLLDSPNLADPAQREAFVLCRDNKTEYLSRIRKLAQLYQS